MPRIKCARNRRNGVNYAIVTFRALKVSKDEKHEKLARPGYSIEKSKPLCYVYGGEPAAPERFELRCERRGVSATHNQGMSPLADDGAPHISRRPRPRPPVAIVRLRPSECTIIIESGLLTLGLPVIRALVCVCVCLRVTTKQANKARDSRDNGAGVFALVPFCVKFPRHSQSPPSASTHREPPARAHREHDKNTQRAPPARVSDRNHVCTKCAQIARLALA